MASMTEDEARQYAINEARKYGLEDEVRGEFDANIKAGYTPEHAAYHALMEWDC